MITQNVHNRINHRANILRYDEYVGQLGFSKLPLFKRSFDFVDEAPVFNTPVFYGKQYKGGYLAI